MDREGHVDYVPTLFVFTKLLDEAHKSQIHKREKRSIRGRLRKEINDQVQVVKEANHWPHTHTCNL